MPRPQGRDDSAAAPASRKISGEMDANGAEVAGAGAQRGVVAEMGLSAYRVHFASISRLKNPQKTLDALRLSGLRV